MMAAALLLLPVAIAAVITAWFIRSRNLQIWLPAYVAGMFHREKAAPGSPVHILLCIADHFEPAWNGADYERETARVDTWHRQYPELAGRYRDADGVPLQYTFFYPEEQYRPEHLDKLAELNRMGLADVEIHLHHDNDTAGSLRRTLTRFKRLLHDRHGLLHVNEETGEVEYAFIHGNWTLDNCGGGRWCGVNNELTVLEETGCYADLTLPAAPEPMQTRKINSIYYAQDDPERPKSHDTGIDARTGETGTGGLLLIQGPLALNWKHRKFGLLPRIECGELSGDNPPSPRRADLWVRQGIHVQGRPDWIFIKLYTHGASERNSDVLLGRPMQETLEYMAKTYNDGVRYALHFVTAREMAALVHAAEAGREGSPHAYRRFRRPSRKGVPA